MRNGKAGQPVQWSKQEAYFARAAQVWLAVITPVSLLANEFDVRSLLHGQVSLAAVNKMYLIHRL